MKKIFILSSVLLLFTYIVRAQQPANPGFENWTQQIRYEDPAPYISTNQWTYQATTMGNVKKITGSYHGLYAAELTTILQGADTTIGALFIGTPGQGGVDGGMPYTGQPDSISGYVKYNVLPNDTAIFAVLFKKSGVLIALAYTSFTGTQATYKRFTIPTGLPSIPAPDSIVVIISSSNLDPPQYPGSTLTIDSISFIGTTQVFPNPSFENWITNSSEEPDNWNTLNFAATQTLSATKSTSSHSGSYAARIETIATSFGDTLGLITNGNFGNNGSEGGMQVFANPSKITGYYKYTAVGLDTAIAAGATYANGVELDSSIVKLPPTNTYTYFECPFTYNNFPLADTLNIVFVSGNFDDSANYFGLGSVLYVDDISIVYLPVGTGIEHTNKAHSVFPNPFSDLAIITFSNPNGIIHELVIYDMLGNTVMKKENINSENTFIQRSHLPAGIYQYRISEKQGGKVSANGKLVID